MQINLESACQTGPERDERAAMEHLVVLKSIGDVMCLLL